MEVVTLSAQGAGIWQQTENTSGEGEEKYFLLFWKFETNILSFIALIMEFGFYFEFFSKLGARKILDS